MIKNLKKTAAFLKKENNFLIVCHSDPDGDTLGSALGLWFVLKKLNKKAVVFCSDHIPEIYRFLPGVNSILKKVPPSGQIHNVISVDSGDYKRLCSSKQIVPFCKTLVNIDHHGDNTYFGSLNLVQPVSCTAELIFRVSQELKVALTQDCAVCLYVAMMTDTGNFKYENTNADTFDIARHLVAAGASPATAAINIYEEKSFNGLTLQAHCFLDAQRTLNGKVIWTVVKEKKLKRYGAKDEDLNGVVDLLRSVRGVEVAILLREVARNKIKLNLRAKKTANVQQMAKLLGGGGHIRSAGAILEGNINAVEKKVVATVVRQLKLSPAKLP